MDDGNRKSFEEAVRNANLPNFDEKLDEAYKRLQRDSKASVQHTPRQQGPEIYCISCPHRHSITWIGPGKKMVGIDEKGMPIIEPM